MYTVARLQCRSTGMNITMLLSSSVRMHVIAKQMLLGFQADLGGISDEIRHLQDESISLNIKLKNRRSAEERLGKFLSNVLVPPELAAAICSDELNDAYLGHVAALNGKIKYVLQNGEVSRFSTVWVCSIDMQKTV
jgi:Vps52 / Sac2 family